jgi:hypothetical protein
MKKIMMTLAAVAVAATMNAQVYLGGSIGFESTSSDGNSETFFSIMPEIGYNLNEDWAVGIVLGYGESRDKVKKTTVDKIKSFTINPYARYTFAKFDKVNLFVDGGVSYTNIKENDIKTNVFSVGLKPGVAVNLNEKLSFVAHAGFLGYTNSKTDDEKAINNVALGIDASSLSFGVFYNF